MSRDIVRTLNPYGGFGVRLFLVSWSTGGLVVAVGVEGEFAVEGDDPDVESVDQHAYGGVAPGGSDSDVVELAVVAQGEFAGSSDFGGVLVSRGVALGNEGASTFEV